MNDTIRVVFAKNPPDLFSNCPNFPTLEPTMQCPFPGWTVEILKMLADAQRLRIQPVIVDNEIGSLNWGTLLDNGTWTGALGYLQNDTADVVCLMYQLTTTRDEDFSYAYPTFNVQPIYAVKGRQGNIGSILWNAFRPYSFVTWMVILGSLLTQILYMVFVTYVEVQLGQRKDFQPSGIAHYSFALLQGCLLLKLYEGLLLTALLKEGDKNPFQDAEGMLKMVASGEYHIVTSYIGNWYFDDMKHSNNTHFVQLRAATAKNPVKVVGTVKEALDLVDQGNFIFPVQQDSLAMQMSRERCGLVYVSEGRYLTFTDIRLGLPSVGAYFVFQNNSRFVSRWSHEVLMQTSFIRRTFDKYFVNGYRIFREAQCPNTDLVEGRSALDLQSTIGIYVLGAIGMFGAIVAFCLEIYVHVYKRAVRRHRRVRDELTREAHHILKVAKQHFDSFVQRASIKIFRETTKMHLRYLDFIDTLVEMKSGHSSTTTLMGNSEA